MGKAQVKDNELKDIKISYEHVDLLKAMTGGNQDGGHEPTFNELIQFSRRKIGDAALRNLCQVIKLPDGALPGVVDSFLLNTFRVVQDATKAGDKQIGEVTKLLPIPDSSDIDLGGGAYSDVCKVVGYLANKALKRP